MRQTKKEGKGRKRQNWRRNEPPMENGAKVESSKRKKQSHRATVDKQ